MSQDVAPITPEQYVKELVIIFSKAFERKIENFKSVIDGIASVDTEKFLKGFTTVLVGSMTKNHKLLEMYLTRNVFDVIGDGNVGKKEENRTQNTDVKNDNDSKGMSMDDFLKQMRNKTQILKDEDDALRKAQDEVRELMKKIREQRVRKQELLEREKMMKEQEGKLEPMKELETDANEFINKLNEQKREIEKLIAHFNSL